MSDSESKSMKEEGTVEQAKEEVNDEVTVEQAKEEVKEEGTVEQAKEEGTVEQAKEEGTVEQAKEEVKDEVTVEQQVKEEVKEEVAVEQNEKETETVESEQPVPLKGVVPEELANTKVICVCSDGEIGIEAGKLQQSKVFCDWFTNLILPKPERLNDPEYKFLVNKVSLDNMKRLVTWMDLHIGKPEPVVKEDELTHARIWFDFTDEEKKFFADIRANKIAELCEAANFLELKSMLLYSSQELFRWMIEMAEKGNIDELRKMIIVDGKPMEPLTPEEEEKVKKKQVWCDY